MTWFIVGFAVLRVFAGRALRLGSRGGTKSGSGSGLVVKISGSPLGPAAASLDAATPVRSTILQAAAQMFRLLITHWKIAGTR